jgi:uridine phosphorylase
MATYPNFAGKHAHDAFFGPEDNIAYVRRLGMLDGFEALDGIVLTYQRSVLTQALRAEGIGKERGHRGIVTLPSTGHRIGLLGGFGFGAPMATLLLEDFVALGTTRFVSIGTAGGLQPGCRVGDVVLCERAVRDEGVSHHYLSPAVYADASPTLTDVLGEAIGSDHVRGASWTIDTPYRETVEEARHYQAEGVLTVEMEAAALFAVGAYRGVDVASAFVVSDSLAELTWDPQMHSDTTAAALDRLFGAAVAALVTAAASAARPAG